jgi:hypothetical protein
LSTNPSNPSLLGQIETSSFGNAHDIEVKRDIAFQVYSNNLLGIFNISDPSSVQLQKAIEIKYSTGRLDVSDENFIYLPQGDKGLGIVGMSYNVTGVDINITGIPVAGESTKGILAADYRNFIAGDPYNITITRISDNLKVFAKNGTLTGEPKQTIPMDWTPQDTSDYLVVAKGDTIVATKKVTLSDSAVISPIPELSTMVLVSTGFLGVLGLTRSRRRN